jgi:hypothetical protein
MNWLEPLLFKTAQADTRGSPVNGAGKNLTYRQPGINAGPKRCAKSPVKGAQERERQEFRADLGESNSFGRRRPLTAPPPPPAKRTAVLARVSRPCHRRLTTPRPARLACPHLHLLLEQGFFASGNVEIVSPLPARASTLAEGQKNAGVYFFPRLTIPPPPANAIGGTGPMGGKGGILI